MYFLQSNEVSKFLFLNCIVIWAGLGWLQCNIFAPSNNIVGASYGQETKERHYLKQKGSVGDEVVWDAFRLLGQIAAVHFTSHHAEVNMDGGLAGAIVGRKQTPKPTQGA